jgi:hypothetical protein
MPIKVACACEKKLAIRGERIAAVVACFCLSLSIGSSLAAQQHTTKEIRKLQKEAERRDEEFQKKMEQSRQQIEEIDKVVEKLKKDEQVASRKATQVPQRLDWTWKFGMVLVALFSVWKAVRAIQIGDISTKRSVIRRSESPLSFFMVVSLELIFAAVFLVLLFQL